MTTGFYPRTPQPDHLCSHSPGLDLQYFRCLLCCAFEASSLIFCSPMLFSSSSLLGQRGPVGLLDLPLGRVCWFLTFVIAHPTIFLTVPVHIQIVNFSAASTSFFNKLPFPHLSHPPSPSVTHGPHTLENSLKLSEPLLQSPFHFPNFASLISFTLSVLCSVISQLYLVLNA